MHPNDPIPQHLARSTGRMRLQDWFPLGTSSPLRILRSSLRASGQAYAHLGEVSSDLGEHRGLGNLLEAACEFSLGLALFIIPLGRGGRNRK